MRGPGGRAPLLPPGATIACGIALPILLACLLGPWSVQWVCAVGVIVVLGVPHGALDVEIGRTLLRHRLGRAWFAAFATPYLALVAGVLVAWQLVPEMTLAAFLALSVWHFGTEENGGGGLAALVQGGLPIALPILIHPHATAQVLSAATGLAWTVPPTWLVWASVLWLPMAGSWVALAIARCNVRRLALPFALSLCFGVLPPLVAFALYFVVVHAPAHTASLIRHPTRIPRVRDGASAWWRALPTTILTVVIGAALWPVYQGDPAVRLVGLTLQLLAALTLPHMLLEAWLTRSDRLAAGCRPQRLVWMAPALQVANRASGALVGCSLVSGLLMQSCMLTAGPDGIRELGPTLLSGL